ADEKVDGGDVSPEHYPREPQRVCPVRDDREDGGVSGHPSERPKNASRIQHERPGHQPGSNDGRQYPADQMNLTHDRAGLSDVQPVGSEQKGRSNPGETPPPQRTDSAAHDDVEGGPLPPEKRQRLLERSLADHGRRIESSAPGLAGSQEHEPAGKYGGDTARGEC